MLVVKESATSNANLYTRDGSFRLNNKGYWLNPSGCVMLGWKLDATGNLPADCSLLESLEQINVSGSSSRATATDTITVGANLNAHKTVLEGAGEIFKVNKTGINVSIKIDEILMPEILGTGSLTIGDKFTLTADPNASKSFVYGGISMSKKISETNFYGTNTVGGQFRIVPGAPANANELQVDTGIRVRVGGRDWVNFKAVRNNANTGQNEFNSLQSLGEKLKSLDLITTIKDDRLVIAPKDGNKAVEFQNFGSNMVETLGLVDITAVANPALDGERFSTLQMLRDKINATKDTFGLFAELNSTAGSVNIHSLLATSSFAIKGQSLGVRSFSRATIGAPLAIGGLAIPEEQRRATVIIDSPKHDLKEGDFVKITGLGNPQTTDGIYMVTGRSSDQFMINLIDNAPANFVAQPPNGTILNVPPPGGYTWQKVAGSSYPLSNAATVDSNGGPAVTITMPGGFVGAGGIGVGDVVYISGIGFKQTATANDDITVPDGYYIVGAVAGNTFNITPTAIAGGAAAAALAGPLTVRKVGNGAGFPVAGINFNTNVMVTTGGIGSNRIKLFMPSHNYTIGDSIRLTGLAAPLAVDGITVRNNMIYKIVDAPNAAALAGGAPNFVTFEVVDAGAGVATTGNEIVGMATYGALGTDVGPNFRVDHYSRTFEYLSLNQEKELFAATYSASDSKLGLSSGNHSADRIFSHSFVVFDSLGGQHTLLARFARLGENRWTVEISAIKSDDGTFEVKTTRPDGVLQSGTLTFEPNGALQSIGDLASPFIAEWTNGSAPGSITIDLGSTGSLVGTGSREGIRQVVAADNVLMFDANGNTAGTLVDVNIDENGNFIAIYDNGTSQKLYRIPIATQIDLDNGMEAYASGYRNKSPVILKEPGIAGTATIISRSVEGSNIDTTASLIELQGLSNDVLATSKTLGIENNNLKTIVNAIEVR